MNKLEKKGIETRTFFIPIEGLHPLYPCVQLTDFRKLIDLCEQSQSNVGYKVDEAEELAKKGDVSAFEFGTERGGDKVYL